MSVSDQLQSIVQQVVFCSHFQITFSLKLLEHSQRSQKRQTVSAPIVLICLGPVVQSIVSLTSSLVVKMLTVLVSTIFKSQLFLLKKM